MGGEGERRDPRRQEVDETATVGSDQEQHRGEDPAHPHVTPLDLRVGEDRAGAYFSKATLDRAERLGAGEGNTGLEVPGRQHAVLGGEVQDGDLNPAQAVAGARQTLAA